MTSTNCVNLQTKFDTEFFVENGHRFEEFGSLHNRLRFKPTSTSLFKRCFRLLGQIEGENGKGRCLKGNIQYDLRWSSWSKCDVEKPKRGLVFIDLTGFKLKTPCNELVIATVACQKELLQNQKKLDFAIANCKAASLLVLEVTNKQNEHVSKLEKHTIRWFIVRNYFEYSAESFKGWYCWDRAETWHCCVKNKAECSNCAAFSGTGWKNQETIRDQFDLRVGESSKWVKTKYFSATPFRKKTGSTWCRFQPYLRDAEQKNSPCGGVQNACPQLLETSRTRSLWKRLASSRYSLLFDWRWALKQLFPHRNALLRRDSQMRS